MKSEGLGESEFGLSSNLKPGTLNFDPGTGGLYRAYIYKTVHIFAAAALRRFYRVCPAPVGSHGMDSLHCAGVGLRPEYPGEAHL